MADLEDLALSAQFHRDQFFRDDWFSMVLDEFKRERGIDARTYLTVRISDFLKRRKIDPQYDVQALAEINRDDVSLLGAAYHIGRKGFLTNHDTILPGESSPMDASAFVGNVLSYLEPLDNSKAATFLENICDVCSKDTQLQQIVAAAVFEILPAVMHRYSMQLSEIQISGKPAKVIGEEEVRLKEWYSTSLNRFVQYVNQAIRSHRNLTLAEFGQYVGIQFGNGETATDKGNGDAKLTSDYVTIVLRQCGNNYPKAIERIEKEFGPIAAVDWDATHDRDACRIPLHIGGKRVQLQFNRKAVDGHLNALFVHMCDYAAAKPDVDQSYAAISRKARPSIEAHFR
ncbi:hypothetical protein HY637_02760 [Candidatus Woesearchaeota archaeon]|nr:hypothetical protein [Candidatus Woesearchaeota archaeon]